MENRRNASSRYPQKPHRIDKKATGEKKEGNREGNYNRDTKNENRSAKWSNRNKRTGNTGKPPLKKRGKPQSKWAKDLPPVTSDEQVTEGKHRGRKLEISKSPQMAPTGRKVREILFRILYRRVRAGRFLDLCAGAGSVGIDAISRGALLVTMVERKAKNCTLIRNNLKKLGISEGHGEVVEEEVIPFLKQMAKRKRYWDVVYFAPPFDFEYDEALEFFKRGVTIKPDGVFVIEHHAEMFFPESMGALKRWKVVVEGDVAMSFYDRRK